MAENMRVFLYGTRGSRTTPNPLFMRYGGNTTCVFVKKERTNLIIDAGSGIIDLGNDLISAAGGVDRYLQLPSDWLVYHIFSTHLHHDHQEGARVFTPALFDSVVLVIYGEIKAGRRQYGVLRGTEAVLRGLQRGDVYPLRFDKRDSEGSEPYMASKKQFVYLAPASEIAEDSKVGKNVIKNRVDLGNLVIDTLRLNHPQRALGYRITDKETGASLAYAGDTEHIIGQRDSNIISGIRDCDLLIYDTSMAHREMSKDERTSYLPVHLRNIQVAVFDKHTGWGHSTLEEAVELAIAANVGYVIGTHHEPRHIDNILNWIVWDIRKEYRRSSKAPHIDLAIEGSVIEVGKGNIRYLYKPKLRDKRTGLVRNRIQNLICQN